MQASVKLESRITNSPEKDEPSSGLFLILIGAFHRMSAGLKASFHFINELGGINESGIELLEPDSIRLFRSIAAFGNGLYIRIVRCAIIVRTVVVGSGLAADIAGMTRRAAGTRMIGTAAAGTAAGDEAKAHYQRKQDGNRFFHDFSSE